MQSHELRLVPPMGDDDISRHKELIYLKLNLCILGLIMFPCRDIRIFTITK